MSLIQVHLFGRCLVEVDITVLAGPLCDVSLRYLSVIEIDLVGKNDHGELFVVLLSDLDEESLLPGGELVESFLWGL